jgi:hypothetical protein
VSSGFIFKVTYLAASCLFGAFLFLSLVVQTSESGVRENFLESSHGGGKELLVPPMAE